MKDKLDSTLTSLLGDTSEFICSFLCYCVLSHFTKNTFLPFFNTCKYNIFWHTFGESPSDQFVKSKGKFDESLFAAFGTPRHPV